MFLGDTWKITRKLTLDYGLRWDLQQPLLETHDREASFGSTVPNENAAGLPGGYIYDGFGAGRCNCNLIPIYPYAIAPRLGIAYQIDPKTVIRGGWGLSYGQLAFTASQPSTTGTGFNTINFNAVGNGIGAGVLGQALPGVTPASLYAATYDPGNLLVPGASIGSALASNIDRNGGRPPRVSQWNITLQREIAKDLVVEAAFMGNKGAWLNEGTNMISYNAVNPATLNALGLGDLTNANTRTLLTSSITSAAAVTAGFKVPYPGFPSTGTVLQSLRPFPQYSSISALWAPGTNRGSDVAVRGDGESGEGAWRSAGRYLPPDSRDAHFEMARVLLRKGQAAQAAQEGEGALRLKGGTTSDIQIHYLLVKAYRDSDQPSQAASHLDALRLLDAKSR